MSWLWSSEPSTSRKAANGSESGNSRDKDAHPRVPVPPGFDMDEPIFDYQFRVIMIGDSMAGKSSLLRKFTFGDWAEVSDPTVGVDFFARHVKLRNDATIELQLWDTAGQERFRSITKAYYRNSVGVMLMYDICDRVSFGHMGSWMLEAKKHIEPHQAVFVLVGCKYDMASKKGADRSRLRQVSQAEAKAFGQQHGIETFETSAKADIRVADPYVSLAQTIYNKVQSGEYQLQEGWDGIKKNYFGNRSYNYASEEGNPISSADLREGEPLRSCC